MENVFGALVILVGVPGLLALSSMLNGWVLKVLWSWFIVPTFHLPELGVASAIGLSFVVGFLTIPSTKSDNKNDAHTILLAMVMKPAFALLFGWILSRFM